MSLTPGTRLGVYEVIARIGKGGMGQVFRATDTKLTRQVALEILPPSLAGQFRLGTFWSEYDVSPKTREFLMVAVDEPARPRLAVALNWPRDAGQ